MLLYGGIQAILSQFPNLEKVAFLSATAAITSVGYCLIALGLTTAKLAMNHKVRGSLKLGMGSEEISSMTKVWNVFQALGNIAFAYTYSMVLLEIQVTVKYFVNRLFVNWTSCNWSNQSLCVIPPWVLERTQ